MTRSLPAESGKEERCSGVDVSVVICTHNQSRFLEKNLTSMMEQSLHPSLFEVIVVDNGSQDATQHVAAAFAERAQNIHYVYEPKIGLSHARNRGVSEAKGRFVAFVDDDAEADRDWLKSLWQAYESDPDAGAAGGKIEVLWPSGGPPHWLHPSLESYYGKFDAGHKWQPLRYPRFPFGGNMSIRRDLFTQIHGFSAELGRRGKSLLSNEEAELFYRLGRQGIKVLYVPGAVVRHHARAERISRIWLVKRAFCQGRSHALMERIHAAGIDKRFYQTMTSVTARLVNDSVTTFRVYLANLLARTPHSKSFARAVTSFAYSFGYVAQRLTNSVW